MQERRRGLLLIVQLGNAFFISVAVVHVTLLLPSQSNFRMVRHAHSLLSIHNACVYCAR